MLEPVRASPDLSLFSQDVRAGVGSTTVATTSALGWAAGRRLATGASAAGVAGVSGGGGAEKSLRRRKLNMRVGGGENDRLVGLGL